MQQKLGLTYLFIGHDLAVVRFMTSRVGVMYFGRLVETGPASGLFRKPLHPYTRRLVAVAAARPLTAGESFGGELPQPAGPTLGLHLPHPLPLCHPALHRGSAGAAARLARTRCRLPLLRKHRSER